MGNNVGITGCSRALLLKVIKNLECLSKVLALAQQLRQYRTAPCASARIIFDFLCHHVLFFIHVMSFTLEIMGE